MLASDVAVVARKLGRAAVARELSVHVLTVDGAPMFTLASTRPILGHIRVSAEHLERPVPNGDLRSSTVAGGEDCGVVAFALDVDGPFASDHICQGTDNALCH